VLSLLGTLPNSPERDGREIVLQLARAGSLLATKGIGSEEAVEAYVRARNVAERRNDANNLIVAMWSLWVRNQSRLLMDEARDLSNQLLILTKNNSDDGLQLQAHHAARPRRAYRCRNRNGG